MVVTHIQRRYTDERTDFGGASSGTRGTAELCSSVPSSYEQSIRFGAGRFNASVRSTSTLKTARWTCELPDVLTHDVITGEPKSDTYLAESIAKAPNTNNEEVAIQSTVSW